MPAERIEYILNVTQMSASDLCKYLSNIESPNDTWRPEPENVTVGEVFEALKADYLWEEYLSAELPAWFKALMIILFTTSMVVSCTGNLRTLIAITINKPSWSTTNAYIANLAISDLLVVCSTTPSEIADLTKDLPVWEFGDFGCYFLPFLQNIAILSNASILCMIAYDRYLCVVKMEQITKRDSTLFTICLLITVWVVSIGMAMPVLWVWRSSTVIVGSTKEPQVTTMDFCRVFPCCLKNPNLSDNFESNIYYFCLCGFIFCPLFLFFSAIYARIAHFLWIRKVVGAGASAKEQMHRKKKIAIALLVLVLAFFICRVPSWIFVMISMTQSVEMTQAIVMLDVVLKFLSQLNTALNPFLYVRIDNPMRKTLASCSYDTCSLFNCFHSCFKAPKIKEQSSFRSLHGTNHSPKTNTGTRVKSNEPTGATEPTFFTVTQTD